MPSTSSYALTHFIKLNNVVLFIQFSVERTHLEMVHFNLPDRLLTFLSEAVVLMWLSVWVGAESRIIWKANQQHGTKKWTFVRREERGAGLSLQSDGRSSTGFSQFLTSIVFNSVVAFNIADISKFWWKSIYDFLPFIPFVHMHIKSLLLMFIIDPFFCCNF